MNSARFITVCPPRIFKRLIAKAAVVAINKVSAPTVNAMMKELPSCAQK